jgi:hypothetical protein
MAPTASIILLTFNRLQLLRESIDSSYTALKRIDTQEVVRKRRRRALAAAQ